MVKANRLGCKTGVGFYSYKNRKQRPEQHPKRLTQLVEQREGFRTVDFGGHADVVGVGEGSVDGARLDGEARTQLVISSVPGVDAMPVRCGILPGLRSVVQATAEELRSGPPPARR